MPKEGRQKCFGIKPIKNGELVMPCAVNYSFIVTYLVKIKIRDLLIVYYFINFIIPELGKY